MTSLPRQIENVILSPNQIAKTMWIADVRNIQRYTVGDITNIKEVAAILRNEAVTHGYRGTQLNQFTRQRGANESTSARD